MNVTLQGGNKNSHWKYVETCLITTADVHKQQFDFNIKLLIQWKNLNDALNFTSPSTRAQKLADWVDG